MLLGERCAGRRGPGEHMGEHELPPLLAAGTGVLSRCYCFFPLGNRLDVKH